MNYENFEIPKDLKFRTKDIVDLGGLSCSVLLDIKDFEDIYEAPNRLTRLEVKLRFSVAGKDIYVGGTIAGAAQLNCDLCLEPFTKTFQEDFTELIPIKAEIIDIMSIVKQTLALTRDISNVCSKTCKGLCGFCGVNKNKQACNCKPPQTSPFAVLKDKFKK